MGSGGREAAEPPWRERKKQLTRERIAATATRLFIDRGFEAVSVAEVAREAEVSAMTVFNYFPRKEDLFLDRIPEACALVRRAVAERPAGTSPLAALRQALVAQVEARTPLGAVGDRFHHWFRVVVDSPSLRDRAREAAQEIEDALTAALVEASDDRADPTRARLTAALAVAAYRTVFVETAARQLAGEPHEEVAATHLVRLAAAFDAVERAVGEEGGAGTGGG